MLVTMIKQPCPLSKKSAPLNRKNDPRGRSISKLGYLHKQKPHPNGWGFLYLSALSGFDISDIHRHGKDCIEDQVQGPGDRKAEHDGVKLAAFRIYHRHPKHTEAQIEKDIRQAGQHGIAEGFQRAGQHAADGIEEHELDHIKEPDHAVGNGLGSPPTHDDADPKIAGQISKESKAAGDHCAISQAEPQGFSHTVHFFRADILPNEGHGGASKTGDKGMDKILHRNGCRMPGNGLRAIGIDG